ncbi:MAG: serine hydrolase [Planctomycetes bacterium]|nr:serine hydrolase [Planctomycetota bacterium]
MKQLLLRALLGLLALPAVAAAQVEDDRENDTPTGTYWNRGVTEAQINTLVGQGWRLTNIAIDSTSPSYTFTVTMVPNSGAYAISTWWYYGITSTTLGNLLTQNGARLTDLEVVDNGSGSARFTCIMVSNTGVNAKSWGYVFNTTTTAITNFTNAGNRIVDLEQYTLNGNTYYAAVGIANTGRDARGWWYYYGISQGTLNSLLSSNNGRIYDLDRVSGGYNVVMLAQGSQKNWRFYGIDEQAVTDQLSQIGARAIDIERYFTLSGYRYDVVMINNSNALSTRISEIIRGGTTGWGGVYFKRANGSVLGYINGDRPHEPASTLKTLHLLQAMRSVQLNTVELSDIYRTYTVGGPDSCPSGSGSYTDESLESALAQMMDRSDNTRTRTITDNFGGFSGLNSRAAALGMTSTDVNHHIGCGTPANVTTLRDIAHLHEQVVNGYLGAERDNFYRLMRQDYVNGGYAFGELWPVMQAEATAAGLNSTQFSAFRNDFLIAFKKGGYGVNGLFYRCWGGYVRIPFYANGGIDLREYMVGSFVSDATNETNAVNTCNLAAAEVLRDELRTALRTYRGYVPGEFTRFGSACAGSNGTPDLDATGTPEIGQRFVYRITSVPRSTPVVLHLGVSTTSWSGIPLPFHLSALGATGCYLRTDVVVSATLSSGILGSTSFGIDIPIDPLLIGNQVVAQALAFDPAANRLGLTTTNGLVVGIGGRP